MTKAIVDPAHVARICAALAKHRRTHREEVEEVLAMIESAHEQAHAALRDEDTSLEYSQLAWAKTLLSATADPPVSAPAQPLPEDAERHVTKKGALAGFDTYEEFNPGWLETLAEYLEHLGRRKPKFGVDPQCIDIESKTSIAIAGDWGTGYWEDEQTGAAKIAALMKDADHTIHIGDTYYAGTQKQVREHLTEKWQPGRVDCFALPGNHEMYTKGWPLMEALRVRFQAQRGTTFFALRNPHWLVLALDTAYFAEHMYLRGTLGPEKYKRRWFHLKRPNEQLAFVRDQLAQRGSRRVILFTHHPPYDLVGPSDKRPLRKEVLDLFAANGLQDGPDYWAWGHIHATAVYRDRARCFRGRLIGHGAIPYGDARELAKHKDDVVFWETKPAGDKRYPERVLNGFLRLELDGAVARESFVAENGETRHHSTF